MLILGCDPASVKMGYGIISAEGERLRCIEAGVLSAPAGWDKYRRLAEIGRCLEEVLDEHAVDAVAIEAGFVKGQMGALTSGAARGVAGYIAARRGIAVVEYAPSTVKLHVAGHGHADKESVARRVQLLLGMNRQASPDAADALAVAVCHARTAKSEGPRVRQRRRGAGGT